MSTMGVRGALGVLALVATANIGRAAGTAHYEYVFPDGSFHVYDMDNGHQLVKSVTLPQVRGIRGVVAHAATHALYISYGGDGNGQNGTPTMLKYDLLSDALVWTRSYAIGIDSMAINPDGSLIYMPTGELSRGGIWYVISASSGDVVGQINGPSGPHNTIVSADGAHVYLGGRADSNLAMVDTASDQVVQWTGPLLSSVRPFTINGLETLAYITVTGLRGFQIGDLTTGALLRTVTFSGPNVSQTNGPSAPSHGISLSPDEREVYVLDWPDYVHVFDVSGLSAVGPRQVADIALNPSMNHYESPCAYDCLADGWLHHSRDGRFVYVGDQGDVIDTATRRPVANLPTLYNTRKMIEIDWEGGVPVFAMNARASIGYVGLSTTTTTQTPTTSTTFSSTTTRPPTTTTTRPPATTITTTTRPPTTTTRPPTTTTTSLPPTTTSSTSTTMRPPPTTSTSSSSTTSSTASSTTSTITSSTTTTEAPTDDGDAHDDEHRHHGHGYDDTRRHLGDLLAAQR